MGRSGDDPKVRRAAPGQTRPCAAAAARAEAGTARAARVAVRKVTQRARAQLLFMRRGAQVCLDSEKWTRIPLAAGPTPLPSLLPRSSASSERFRRVLPRLIFRVRMSYPPRRFRSLLERAVELAGERTRDARGEYSVVAEQGAKPPGQAGGPAASAKH